MSKKRTEYLKRKKSALANAKKQRLLKIRSPQKIEMHIDESGNSGLELFSGDDYFICCGMLTNKGAFHRTSLEHIRTRIKEPLHGSKLGLKKLEGIADDLLQIFQSVRPFFIVSFVEKPYFCAMKLWDCIFDAAHNPGVTGIHISMAPLRFVGMAKFCRIVPRDQLKTFWQIYKCKDYDAFVSYCEALKPVFASSELDERSKKLIEDALCGAQMRPRDILGNGPIKEDSPNVTAVTMMCHHLNEMLQGENVKLVKISHDRQDQFKNNIEYMFNAIKHVHVMWGMQSILPTYAQAANIKGSLVVAEDSNDQLDLTDIACYLLKKYKDADVHGKCGELTDYIWSRTCPLMMNQYGVETRAENYYREIMAKPFTEEDKVRAMAVFQKLDDARAERLRTGDVEW